MAAIPTEQETSFLHMLLKPFIGLFNAILPLVWFISFAFAIVFSVALARDPRSTVLTELVLVPFVILSGTHVTRHTAFKAQREAAERIRIQQAADSEIAPDLLETVNAVIPSYWSLLRRNVLIALFFVPLMAITGIVIFESMTGIIDLMRNTAEDRSGAKLLSGLMVIPLVGWMAVIGVGLKLIGAIVDGRILRTKFDLPVDEETRQKRQMREMTKATLSGTITPFMWVRNGVLALLAILLIPLIFIVPLSVITGLLQLTSLPENVKVAVLGVVMLAYSFGLMIAFPIYLKRRMSRRMTQELDELDQDLKIVTDPEEREELYQLRNEIEADVRLEKSSESLMTNVHFQWFFGLMGGVFILSFIIAMIARSVGVDGETAKGIMAGTMLLGMIGVLVFAGQILSRLAPKSAMMQAMEQYESALRRGQYETLIPLVDKLMHDLPNWETRIPGAAAYAQAGRLEEAERITREAMKELADPRTEMQRAMFKPLMGGAFGLLTEIYMMGGRFDEAETSLKRAQEFDDDSYAVNNTTAKFHLYRGQQETALPFIDRAEKGYLKAKEPVSAYNKGLRAWALALTGRSAEADALMVEAIKQVPVEHNTDIAEVYLLGGYVARAQGKRSGARRSFEMAAKFDAKGIYGQIAERELRES